jgi:hypothetical protein
LTGGRATIVDYAGKGLARINETTRAEYLLGYYPANANWDGRYRRIDVKVNRPGVRVSFRHGYFARESPPVLNLAEMRSVRRISAAGAYATEVRDVPFEVNACVDPFGPQQVRVDIRIRPENVELTHLNGRYTGQLRVTVYYADSRGRYLGEAWKNVNFNLTEPTYLVCAGPGIPVTIMIPLKAKKQIIKVVIYDPHRDRLGSQLVRLQ